MTIKIILETKRSTVGSCRELLQGLESAATVLRHHSPDMNGTWTREAVEDWSNNSEDRWISWLTIHAFDEWSTAGDPEPVFEDERLFNVSNFAQAPESVWEFYLWDDTEAMLVIHRPFKLKLYGDWAVTAMSRE